MEIEQSIVRVRLALKPLPWQPGASCIIHFCKKKQKKTHNLNLKTEVLIIYLIFIFFLDDLGMTGIKMILQVCRTWKKPLTQKFDYRD